MSIPYPAIEPQSFSSARSSAGSKTYLDDPLVQKLIEFFERKGIAALKEEDRREQWYDDWLDYQAKHQIYARLLSPKRFSSLGGEFDLLKIARFLEVFGYFSPAHGYSLQVSFLALFAILMGKKDALKQEAVATLEAGGLLAFGVSEKDHGADLLGNEFIVRETALERFVANGKKYYIGNANAAQIIAILARKEGQANGCTRREPFMFFALRPRQSNAYRCESKIHTLGVRAGYVGNIEVKDHEFTAADVICEGRQAWDSMFGTVTLGKFFLGFASIGICEHAFAEATAHLTGRILYGKPAIEMAHIRSAMAQAFARLSAMKLYAYRALDYVQAASAKDRRYLLFTAVQKARVSTEGLKVMALLSECMGAKAFEADSYFEMALRDAQLIPSVEGSTHINLDFAARFIPRYFGKPDRNAPSPPFSAACKRGENPYLMEARTGGQNGIAFPHFLRSYQPLMSIANLRIFARQAHVFRRYLRLEEARLRGVTVRTDDTSLLLGQCLAAIAYGQLIAENAKTLEVPRQMISIIFHLLIADLSTLALTLAAFPNMHAASRTLLRRMMAIPRSTSEEWEFVADRTKSFATAAT